MFLFGPPNVEKMQARRDVQGLIKVLGYKKDDKVRQAAAEALVKIGAPAVEPLIAALQDKNKDVRRAAAEALGKIRDTRAVEPLIAALKKDEEWYVHKTAAEALGQIGDVRAVEPLIVALKEGDMRRVSAEALGKIGDTRAVEPLIATLKDKDSDVCKAAAEALGKLGDDRAIEPLIAALKIWELSRVAAIALDRLGWQPGEDETAARYWIAKQEWDKCAALGPVAMETSLSLLEESAHAGAVAQATHRDWFCYLDGCGFESVMLGFRCVEMREAAIQVLVKIGAPAVPLLINRLQAPSAWMKMTFAWALGELGDARAINPLTDLLKDEQVSQYEDYYCDCFRQAVTEALDKINRR